MERLVFGNREEGISYIKRPGVYGICLELKEGLLSVAVINTPRGKFLPGGGIEPGEDHETCLQREFIEETGFNIEVFNFIGEADQVGFTPRSKRYLELQGSFYFITIKDFRGGKVENDHELIWLPVQEAINLMHLAYQSYAISEALKIYNQKSSNS